MNYNEAKVESERSIRILPIVQAKKNGMGVGVGETKKNDGFKIGFRSRVDNSCWK